MCLVQVTGVLCFFLLISNVMYVSSSVIYRIRMARFRFIAEGEYFFLLLLQFLVSFDFLSIYGQGLKLTCTPSCVTPSGVGFKNAWNHPSISTPEMFIVWCIGL
jgi:hypothetical protein